MVVGSFRVTSIIGVVLEIIQNILVEFVSDSVKLLVADGYLSVGSFEDPDFQVLPFRNWKGDLEIHLRFFCRVRISKAEIGLVVSGSLACDRCLNIF